VCALFWKKETSVEIFKKNPVFRRKGSLGWVMGSLGKAEWRGTKLGLTGEVTGTECREVA
jgi:hypothetical protein